MAVEGTLDLFKLPEILQLISQQQKTGILTVQGQQDIVAISFLNGRIVAADALNQTLEQGLADVLVREGLLSAPEFARASAEHQSSGARLLDVLVERRFVERPQLLHALRLQTYRLLQQLLRWSEGDFKFYSGDEVSYEEGFVPIPVDELLFQIAQRNATAAASAPRPVPVPPAAAPVPEGGLGPLPGPDELSRRPAAPAEEAARQGARVVRREGTPPAPGRVVPAGPAEGEVAAGPFRKMKVEAPAAEAGAQPVAPKILAAGLAILLFTALLLRPAAVLLPFPWQEREREALAQDLRSSQYLKIDQAAKTWFLLEGRFPASLGDLVTAGLLTRADLRDPQGYPIRYEPGEESYTLQPMEGGKPVAGAETSEAITGNFLLDPEILTVPAESAEHPLVLLD
ncbi:MAG TPA: DUF4388 domain-containing protein [Thermoanaerobaculia bacterium]|nr:DUF4388 domain-containing protein [Thermoanaerobaculia bacterium]